jgi:hypothetical protein
MNLDLLNITPLQQELLAYLHDYKDLLFIHEALEHQKEIRFIYLLHAVNHIFKYA